MAFDGDLEGVVDFIVLLIVLAAVFFVFVWGCVFFEGEEEADAMPLDDFDAVVFRFWACCFPSSKESGCNHFLWAPSPCTFWKLLPQRLHNN